MRTPRKTLALLLLSCGAARADYGWIPEYEKLNLRIGGQYYTTQDNFLPDGSLGALTSGPAASLHETRFFLEGEYGIAADWAARLKLDFVNAGLDDGGPAGTLATGTGFGDLWTTLKWNCKADYPILTFEGVIKTPLARPYVTNNTQLVTTDGNFEIGGILHTATKAGRFLFSMSPGLMARLGGFSPAAVGDIAVQFNMRRGYLRAYGTGIYAFQDVQPYDRNASVHDAPGSGGSYAKLNGSPIGLTGGAKLGLVPADNVRVEFDIQRALWGQKYPSYTSFGMNVMYTFDFFQPKKTTRLREVPFEGEQPNGYPATP